MIEEGSMRSMRFIAVVMVLAAACVSCSVQEIPRPEATIRTPGEVPAGPKGQYAHPLLAEYERINQKESRYRDWQDSRAMLVVKLRQVDVINKNRSRYGAGPVRLDILASRVANRTALEAAKGNFHGHFNLRGEKPYHRYAFAGGQDHVSENAASITSSAPLSRNPESLANLMRRAHSNFMAETAPNDGHKQNCIEPAHNFVGLGAYIDGGQFRYFEEYIDRYLVFDSVPQSVGRNQSFTVSVRPISDQHYVYAAVVYYDAFPVPMTRKQIDRIPSYMDYTNVQAASFWPWELEKYKSGKTYRFAMKFSKRGLYYFHIYLHDRPYDRRSASTQGKVQGSGLVVAVR